jgi:Ser/Thr protein kinase RdoA (MazF antagonist)
VASENLGAMRNDGGTGSERVSTRGRPMTIVVDANDQSTVGEFLFQEFGIEVQDSRALGGELDTNTWFRDIDGREYALKISHTDDPAHVTWQNDLLRHLSMNQNRVDVPVILPSRSGEHFVTVQSAEGAADSQVARVATWVSGSILSTLPEVSTELLEEWGEVAAVVTTALQTCPTDGIPVTHYWDMRSAVDAVDFSLPYVTDLQQRRHVEVILENAKPFQKLLQKLPLTLIHQDLNDFNVVAQSDAAGKFHITGVLDIGDAIEAPAVSELIVAVAYGMLGQPDPIAAASSIVRGYARLRDLTELELSLLFPLAALRLCVNATTWTRRAAEANAEYGSRRMGKTWPTIALLSEVDVDTATASLTRAYADSIARHSKEFDQHV